MKKTITILLSICSLSISVQAQINIESDHSSSVSMLEYGNGITMISGAYKGNAQFGNIRKGNAKNTHYVAFIAPNGSFLNVHEFSGSKILDVHFYNNKFYALTSVEKKSNGHSFVSNVVTYDEHGSIISEKEVSNFSATERSLNLSAQFGSESKIAFSYCWRDKRTVKLNGKSYSNSSYSAAILQTTDLQGEVISEKQIEGGESRFTELTCDILCNNENITNWIFSFGYKAVAGNEKYATPEIHKGEGTIKLYESGKLLVNVNESGEMTSKNIGKHDFEVCGLEADNKGNYYLFGNYSGASWAYEKAVIIGESTLKDCPKNEGEGNPAKNCFLVKLDPDGKTLWKHEFSNKSYMSAKMISINSDNIIVSGDYMGYMNSGPKKLNGSGQAFKNDSFVFTYDLSGNLISYENITGSRHTRIMAKSVDGTVKYFGTFTKDVEIGGIKYNSSNKYMTAFVK